MAIKKPPEIPEFKDTSAEESINEIKEGIVEFGMKSLDKNDIKYLSQDRAVLSCSFCS